MKNRPFMTAALAAFAVTLSTATPVRADDAGVTQVRERMQEIDPSFEPDQIRPTRIDGLYEVISGANVFYISRDGRLMVRGQIVDLETNRNLTAERRRQLVQQEIEALGEDSMLVYPPREGPPRHSITVFTDTTCPYCRQLHAGLMELVKQYPVKVRYLMFPRAGLAAGSADTLRNIWCAADPQAAMTAAKTGGSVAQRSESCETPIKEHFNLAREIGVSGTPYMLVDDHIVSGYRPNETLLRMMGLQASAGEG